MKPRFAVMLSKALPAKGLATRANDFKINKNTLRAYRSGTRVPPRDVAQGIADIVFSDAGQRQSFLNEVENASPQRSQLESLSGHYTKLKVSTIAFSAVSRLLKQPNGDPARNDESDARSDGEMPEQRKAGFVDTIFLRFLRLSGVEWESQMRSLSADVREQLWNGAIDVALSYFTTIERALLVRFWQLPIRLTIGALCHTDFRYADPKQQVLDALNYRTPGVPKLGVMPIVLRGSAAHLHCTATLRYVDGQTMRSVDTRDFQQYHEVYEAVRQEFPDKIPVLVDDELSVAEMLGAVGPDGKPLFPDYFPALPLTSESNAREDLFKRESPIYFVSIACSRRNENLWSFLDDALRLLLTDIYTTSQAYAELYFDLLEIMKKAAPQFLLASGGHMPSERVDLEATIFSLAHEWVTYTLHLTRFGMSQFSEAYPHWKSVLTQSRSLIFDRLADGSKRDEITYLIQSMRVGRGGARSKGIDETLLHLEQFLDLDLRLVDASARKYAELAPGALYQIVTERLKGSRGAPKIQTSVVMYEFGKALDGVVLVGVKAVLQNAKEAIGSGSRMHASSDPFVHWVPEDPNAVLTKDGGRVFVATWLESDRFPDPAKRVLGVALVVPLEGQVEDQRLEHLWVDPKYRGMGIGRCLIDNAVAAARASFVKRIVVLLSDSTQGSLTAYFRQIGFELHSDLEWHKEVSSADEGRGKPKPLTMSRLVGS